jgi:hypothetical protein
MTGVDCGGAKMVGQDRALCPTQPHSKHMAMIPSYWIFLKLIADANLGGQGLIKIYLHTESSISASLVIHSVGIDLQ